MSEDSEVDSDVEVDLPINWVQSRLVQWPGISDSSTGTFGSLNLNQILTSHT